MGVTGQKFLVGLLGIALCASVITAGYVDARRSQKKDHSVAASSVTPLQDPQLERGRQVYEKSGCVVCHGSDGKHGAPNLNAQTGQQVPPVAYVADTYTKAQLIKKIDDGVPHVEKLNPNGPNPPLYMPSYTNSIADAQMEDLVAYLFSLKPKGEDLGF